MRASAALLLLCLAASCGGRNNGAAGDAGDAAAAPSSPEVGVQETVPESPGDVVQDRVADVAPDVATNAAEVAGPDGPADTEAGDAPSGDAPSGDAPPGPRKYKAIAITAGRYHMCALLEDHRVKCWGSNSYGQLGLGDLKHRGIDPADMGDNLPAVDLGTGRTAKAITAGRYATCALLDNGSVKCWGWAALAVGAQNPTPHASQLGDEPGEMGDALAPIDIGPGHTARSVTMGYYTGCVVRGDWSARCWGSTLPPHDIPPVPGGHHYAQVVGSRGVVSRWDDGTLGVVSDGFVPQPPMGSPAELKALTIAGSVREACALFVGNVVNCSESRQAGWPATFAGPVAELALTELGIRCWRLEDGRVQCRGASVPTPPWVVANGAGDPFVRLGQPATALTSGGIETVCALLANGEVKCWSGRNAESADQGGSVATATDWPPVDLGTVSAP